MSHPASGNWGSLSETNLLQILQHPDIANDLKSAAFTVLRRLCGTFGKLPRSCLIDHDFNTQEEIPFATRGYIDLWKKDWNGQNVAVKELRFGPDDDVGKTTKVVILFTCKSPSIPRVSSRSPVEILQRSVVLETLKSPQHPPISWSFDDPESVLHRFSVDGGRQHSELY
jgi:hypothetical protein